MTASVAKAKGGQSDRLIGEGRVGGRSLAMRRAIAREQAKFLQRYEVTPDRLIREFSKIAFSNTDDFIAIQDDGSAIVDFSTATREQLASLAAFEAEEYTEGRGKDARLVKRNSQELRQAQSLVRTRQARAHVAA
jgi:phage terminase small subunit